MDDVVGFMVVKVRGVIDFKECGNYILNNISKKKGVKDRKKSKMKMVLILLSIFIIIFLVLFKIILDIVLIMFFG